jgi:hypothetical protein
MYIPTDLEISLLHKYYLLVHLDQIPKLALMPFLTRDSAKRREKVECTIWLTLLL